MFFFQSHPPHVVASRQQNMCRGLFEPLKAVSSADTYSAACEYSAYFLTLLAKVEQELIGKIEEAFEGRLDKKIENEDKDVD